MEEKRFRGAGGTDGGIGLFILGFALALGALYFFFDSVRVATEGYGLMTGMMHNAFGGAGGGNMHSMWDTTSMGIIFVPFFIGVIILFYDYRLWSGRILTGLGLAIIVIEILSRIRFYLNVKTTHLLLMVIMLAAGVAFILRSFRDTGKSREKPASAAPPAGQP